MGKTDRITLTLEQERWLVRHYKHTKNEELGSRLGISQSALHRFARELGLKKSKQFMQKCAQNGAEAAWVVNRRNGWPPKGYIIPKSREYGFQKGITCLQRLGPEREAERIRKSAESRRATVKRERARIVWGLEQKTKLKLVTNPKKIQYRYALRQHGYEIGRGESVAYVVDGTRRSTKIETNALKHGIRIIED